MAWAAAASSSRPVLGVGAEENTGRAQRVSDGISPMVLAGRPPVGRWEHELPPIMIMVTSGLFKCTCCAVWVLVSMHVRVCGT